MCSMYNISGLRSPCTQCLGTGYKWGHAAFDDPLFNMKCPKCKGKGVKN